MIVALGLLVMLPAEAEIVTVPSAPEFPVGLTTPAETVAMPVLLDVQVAVSVMSITPLHVVAIAFRVTEVFPPLAILPLVGLIAIDWMQPTVTVSDAVPVMVGF